MPLTVSIGLLEVFLSIGFFAYFGLGFFAVFLIPLTTIAFLPVFSERQIFWFSVFFPPKMKTSVWNLIYDSMGHTYTQKTISKTS